ncbi:acyl-CoA dehydrogenase NM domain-like protein [Meredithblackwellia eburnea MCA 4105]
MSKVIATDQVASHNSNNDAWLIIDGKVYDVTKFADDHPGGKKILLRVAGTDCSEQFHKFHSPSVLNKQAAPLKIGVIGDPNASKDDHESAVAESSSADEDDLDETYFGDLVPYGDPYWYQDWASPYYKDSHRKVRAAVRKFTDEHLTPNAAAWDEAHAIPEEDYKRVASSGILASIAAAGQGWHHELAKGIPVPGDIDPNEWDAFHNFVVIDELCRCGSGGILYGLIGGFGIGLPPVLHFGSEELQKRVVPPCLKGEKRICLAITEPAAGSDVANLTTTAKLSEDGKHYIVNGEKKWITNGVYSTYFVTAVRTGGKGMNGLSLLVIERGPGVTTRQMNCQGVWASGTTYISFEDVKVPVENLLGKENKGFQLIMSNFNPERIGIAIQANRFARVCLEESIKYASKRKTFGVLLRDHPVIRNKLAHMARRVEATHSWIESVIFQSTAYDADSLTMRGGGMIALLKVQATDTFDFCAREASQILGGLSYSRGGQGEKIERLYREVRAYTIPGGSSEIMLDLGMRQSIKIAEVMGAKF